MKDGVFSSTIPKVNMPNFNSVSYLNCTPIFEWCVVRVGSKNEHHKDMSIKQIGLHAQNLFIILSSIVSIIEGPT